MNADALLIYDGDCAFCKNSLLWAINHLTAMPRYVAYQNVDLTEYQLSLTEVQTQVWLVDGQNHLGGHLAVAWLFNNQPAFGWRIIGALIKTFGPLSALVYRWIAKNRYQWFGKKEQCLVPTSEIQSKFLN